jgi:hypothetical protein
MCLNSRKKMILVRVSSANMLTDYAYAIASVFVYPFMEEIEAEIRVFVKKPISVGNNMKPKLNSLSLRSFA